MLAMVFVLSPPLSAQETEALWTEQEFLGEMPVVLSATRLSQPKWEVPAAVTINLDIMY